MFSRPPNNLHCVEQNEINVQRITSPDLVLESTGVTTCICFAAKCRLGSMYFLALFHWEGFSAEFVRGDAFASSKALEEVNSAIARFALAIGLKMGVDEPCLERLYVVGGESGSEQLTGTELEIKTIREYIQPLCAAYFTTDENTMITDHGYRSSNEGSLTVRLSEVGIQIIDENELTPRLGV